MPRFRADAGLPGRLRNHIAEQFFALAAVGIVDAFHTAGQFVALIQFVAVEHPELAQFAGERVRGSSHGLTRCRRAPGGPASGCGYTVLG